MYITCLVFGFPANVISSIHFNQQHRELSTWLYIIITITDSCICFLSSFVGFNFYLNREGVWFDHRVFCMLWRFSFKTLQRFSVALVLTLSVSRTINLVWPLRYLRKKVVLSFIAGYAVYLIVEFLFIGRLETFQYQKADVYCYEEMKNEPLSILNDSLHTATLAIPIIPIIASCVLSVYYVRRSYDVSKFNPSSSCVKKRATVTVIVFTALYVAFNIPVMINMILWIITSQTVGWPGPFYQGSFMQNYLWNVTDVLSVSVNATCNPLVYILRFKRCQRWFRWKITRLYYLFLTHIGQGDKIRHSRNTGLIMRRYNTSRCPSPNSEQSPIRITHVDFQQSCKVTIGGVERQTLAPFSNFSEYKTVRRHEL